MRISDWSSDVCSSDLLDPNVYIARPYAAPATRMKAFIGYTEKIPAVAAQIKANLKLPLPATYVKFGTAGFGGFADYYTGDAKAAFAEVKDEALQKRFDEVAGEAAAALKDLESGRASCRERVCQNV